MINNSQSLVPMMTRFVGSPSTFRTRNTSCVFKKSNIRLSLDLNSLKTPFDPETHAFTLRPLTIGINGESPETHAFTLRPLTIGINGESPETHAFTLRPLTIGINGESPETHAFTLRPLTIGINGESPETHAFTLKTAYDRDKRRITWNTCVHT